MLISNKIKYNYVIILIGWDKYNHYDNHKDIDYYLDLHLIECESLYVLFKIKLLVKTCQQ